MTDLTLTRFCHADFGTFGEMLVGGAMLYTVERPWLDNRPRISCIPVGTYTCGPRYFFRGGYDAIEIRDVPGRSHILFHRANRPSELAGCIAPTAGLGCLQGEWAGLNSRAAFDLLMQEYGGREFELEIR